MSMNSLFPRSYPTNLASIMWNMYNVRDDKFSNLIQDRNLRSTMTRFYWTVSWTTGILLDTIWKWIKWILSLNEPSNYKFCTRVGFLWSHSIYGIIFPESSFVVIESTIITYCTFLPSTPLSVVFFFSKDVLIRMMSPSRSITKQEVRLVVAVESYRPKSLIW